VTSHTAEEGWAVTSHTAEERRTTSLTAEEKRAATSHTAEEGESRQSMVLKKDERRCMMLKGDEPQYRVGEATSFGLDFRCLIPGFRVLDAFGNLKLLVRSHSTLL
jgi:hypothetical protein